MKFKKCGRILTEQKNAVDKRRMKVGVATRRQLKKIMTLQRAMTKNGRQFRQIFKAKNGMAHSVGPG